jgi:hypothetical protein
MSLLSSDLPFIVKGSKFLYQLPAINHTVTGMAGKLAKCSNI